jgi:hypothetical protein
MAHILIDTAYEFSGLAGSILEADRGSNLALRHGMSHLAKSSQDPLIVQGEQLQPIVHALRRQRLMT